MADPSPGAGEAVIEVTASDVMFLDTLLRSGWGEGFFPVRPPYVPGSGVVGTSSGGRVVADTKQDVGGAEIPVGGYASRAVVAESELVPVPSGLTDHQAVAFLHDGPTLQSLLPFVAGPRVLVAAAAGGAGVLLVQSLAARGLHVVAAARGSAKTALVRSPTCRGWTARSAVRRWSGPSPRRRKGAIAR
ncbi:hypothetical protein [Actinomycetospora succinea]|nr:hypothetical protein [Actinomycetospora succinea]